MDYTAVISFGLLLTFLWLVYSLFSYRKQSINYWKDQGVPCVSGIPFIGSFLENQKYTFQGAEVRRYKNYGRIYGFLEGFHSCISVAEPDLLRDIFIKDFHVFPGARDFSGADPMTDKIVVILRKEEWKRVRTIITPAFTTGKIRKMFSIIEDAAATLSRNLSNMAKTGEPTDIKRMYGAFSMDVIASCAFGTKVDSHNDPDNPFITAASKAANSPIWKILLMYFLPKLMRFLGVSALSPDATEYLKKAIIMITEERKRTGKRHKDLLQVMMDAVDEAKKGKLLEKEDDTVEDDIIKAMGHEEENENVFKLSSLKNKGLDFDELVANCVMFFFVGYETVALTLTFITYNLAVNPDCQEKLIAEIDENICQNQNKLTYEGVYNMKYLDMVISETLRLYPVAIRTERLAEADYTLGETGIVVKKGAIVTIPIYAIHHDPENFPEPEKFNPMRFTREEKAKRNGFTYLPFSAGPRNCLGMRFALNELKICIAYIMSQYRFRRCRETKIPIEFDSGGGGLLQPKQILVKVEERADKVLNH